MRTESKINAPVESTLILKLRQDIRMCRIRLKEAHRERQVGLVSAYQRSIDVRKELIKTPVD